MSMCVYFGGVFSSINGVTFIYVTAGAWWVFAFVSRSRTFAFTFRTDGLTFGDIF